MGGLKSSAPTRALNRIILNDKILRIQVFYKKGRLVGFGGVVAKTTSNSGRSSLGVLDELIGIDFAIE